ncbi:MAG: hypothetical protein HJJLKODD_00733 [Phycisphaerae bacterium]|nr:hypothetical protein [Phycisphaerae bacterium]
MSRNEQYMAGVVVGLLTTLVLAEGPVATTQPAGRTEQKVTATTTGQPVSDPNINILAKLQRTVVQVNFTEEPLEEVILWFREQGLKNCYVHWNYLEEQALVDRQTPVTLSMTEVTLAEVLDQVLAEVSQNIAFPDDRLTYQIRQGMVHISARREFNQQVVVRTYYVEDLLRKLLFFDDAPELSVKGGGGGGRTGGVVEDRAARAVGAVERVAVPAEVRVAARAVDVAGQGVVRAVEAS